jgi:hypothetical protein
VSAIVIIDTWHFKNMHNIKGSHELMFSNASTYSGYPKIIIFYDKEKMKSSDLKISSEHIDIDINN